MADLARWHYTEADLLARVYDERFLALMAHEAGRADGLFRDAAACLPAADRAALLPARIMGEIYQVLLRKMQAGSFRVFQHRYSVSKARKLAILSKHLLA
jgi:phytoene synthase